MAISSNRRVIVEFTDDIYAVNKFAASENSDSPGKIDIVTLAAGANTITPPSGGTTPKALTIIPPSDNALAITLKGVAGDTGVVLHPTDPTSVALNSPIDTLVLSVGTEIVGVQLIWS